MVNGVSKLTLSICFRSQIKKIKNEDIFCLAVPYLSAQPAVHIVNLDLSDEVKINL